MAEDQNPPADEQDQNTTSAFRPGKNWLIILGIVVIVMVIVALVWWFLTRNEEAFTDDAFTDGDVGVTIAPKRQATSPNFACGMCNQREERDVLVVIDPRDTTTAQRDQAQPSLGWCSCTSRRSCCA